MDAMLESILEELNSFRERIVDLEREVERLDDKLYQVETGDDPYE